MWRNHLAVQWIAAGLLRWPDVIAIHQTTVT
jgi:hypothetical protein